MFNIVDRDTIQSDSEKHMFENIIARVLFLLNIDMSLLVASLFKKFIRRHIASLQRSNVVLSQCKSKCCVHVRGSDEPSQVCI